MYSKLTFNIQLTHLTPNLSSQHPTLALNIQSLNELPVSIDDVEFAMNILTNAMQERDHEQYSSSIAFRF